MTKNNIEVSPEHIHWFNYVLKIWNTSTNEVFYKDGKILAQKDYFEE